MPKIKEKEKAINLREEGYSYSEILKEIFVAKSTLSLWLRNVGLSKKQKQRLTEKKLMSMKRGWEARRDERIKITEKIKNKAKSDIKRISKRELWLMGIMLYWAEGAKEKKWNVSVNLKFSNSDPLIIKLYIKWLKKICLVSSKDIVYELYIHDTADWKKAKKYWSRIINIPSYELRIYFKHNKRKTKRGNIGSGYNGIIMVRVKKSVNLNRKVQGWIEAIYQHCGVV